jgi:hypothetical protein
MKTMPILTLALLFSLTAYSQEFTIHDNGLIYSEQTMNKLGHIVDSLNLKFKTCDLDKTFYSKYQTLGHIITMEEGDIDQARADMDNQMPLDAFLEKHPQASIEKNSLIIKDKYENYEGEEVVEITDFNLKSNYGFGIHAKDPDLYDKDLQNQWLYQYYSEERFGRKSIGAFYFPHKFTSVAIPQQYTLMIAYADCLIDTNTNKFKDELEEGWSYLPDNWASMPLQKQKRLLDQMRSTRVVGSCSQDSGPREHAMNIALLSAETANWEVFLKAHLDIMNDRFERVTDGSYAWGARKTYIKELETLDINLIDLILGISLSIENPATNHYYGSIGRLGRALSETQKQDKVEEAILSAITDTSLDDYNRLLMYFLFINYNYHLDDEARQQQNKDKLAVAVASFPDYYSSRLNKED